MPNDGLDDVVEREAFRHRVQCWAVTVCLAIVSKQGSCPRAEVVHAQLRKDVKGHDALKHRQRGGGGRLSGLHNAMRSPHKGRNRWKLVAEALAEVASKQLFRNLLQRRRVAEECANTVPELESIDADMVHRADNITSEAMKQIIGKMRNKHAGKLIRLHSRRLLAFLGGEVAGEVGMLGREMQKDASLPRLEILGATVHGNLRNASIMLG